MTSILCEVKFPAQSFLRLMEGYSSLRGRGMNFEINDDAFIIYSDYRYYSIYFLSIDYYSLKKTGSRNIRFNPSKWRIRRLFKEFKSKNIREGSLLLKIYNENLVFELESSEEAMRKEIRTYRSSSKPFKREKLIKKQYSLHFSINKKIFLETIRNIKQCDQGKIFFKYENLILEIFSNKYHSHSRQETKELINKWKGNDINWKKWYKEDKPVEYIYPIDFFQYLNRITRAVPDHSQIMFYMEKDYPLRIQIPSFKPLSITFECFLAPIKDGVLMEELINPF